MRASGRASGGPGASAGSGPPGGSGACAGSGAPAGSGRSCASAGSGGSGGSAGSAGSGGSGRLSALAWPVALVLWIAFIWGMSLTPGNESSGMSGWVVERLLGLFHALGVTDHSAMTFAVRKTAHFLEYAVLGVLALKAFEPLRRRGEPVAWAACAAILCAMVPVADETIQLHVPGRSGQVADMLLDLCGALTGLVIAGLLIHSRASRGIRQR